MDDNPGSGAQPSIWWDEDDGIPNKAAYDSMRPEDRPAEVQRLYELSEFLAAERFRIYRKAAYAESKIPDPGFRPDGTKRQKPCIAIAIITQWIGNRYYRWDLWSISSYGEIPDEVLDEIPADDIYTTPDDEYMHGEERIVEHIRRLNEMPEYADCPFTIESIAAAFPICWERCQRAMRNANVRPASPLKNIPREALPYADDDDNRDSNQNALREQPSRGTPAQHQQGRDYNHGMPPTRPNKPRRPKR